MNYEKLFSHSVTAILLGMAVYSKSPYFAVVAVTSLAVGAMYEVYGRLLAVKEQKVGLPDDVKRTMQDMNARIATLEYGVKTRGF